nr:CPBP family intramembrane glutamic endopeptidase [Corynebacterium poyangense]
MTGTPSRLRWEILIVLGISFGMSGLRAALRLIDALLSPTPLNQQQVTLNAAQSQLPWLDFSLQLCSASVLLGWAGLALYLLKLDGITARSWQRRDILSGMALAAVIGIPGLLFYISSVRLGLSREVIPAGFDYPLLQIPSSLVWAAANAVSEEIIVVFWLSTRLGQLGWKSASTLAACSVLRGSYHLYQGISAGCGNIIMGLVFGYVYHRTGRIWPLVIAHFLIDAIAFVGYNAIGGLPI